MYLLELIMRYAGYAFVLTKRGFQLTRQAKDDESCSAGKKSLSPPPEDVNHVLTPRIEPPSNSLSPFILHVPRTEDCLEPLIFDSATAMLDYVTLNWKNNFVTTDICTRALVEIFIKRPFFMLISVDAPLLVRYSRLQKRYAKCLVTCCCLTSG